MGFIVIVILSFIFLDWPWRGLVILAAAAYEAFEIGLWLRWRNKRAITGHEAMVGATGRAVSDCRPDGTVRVRGTIWKAHCPAGVDSGQDIVVTAMHGLRLDVAPK